MSAPSVSYSITIRLEVPASGTALSELTATMEALGGSVTALDVISSDAEHLSLDVTIAATSTAHADQIVQPLHSIKGVTLGRFRGPYLPDANAGDRTMSSRRTPGLHVLSSRERGWERHGQSWI